ncbi:MAG TPA: heavy metal-binding domain-containing protein [Solirubrobacteraceae bacterium]|nr:heavy metal-binding domain-containing protein [Solirubrobacteraceae bacterium]
MSRREPDAGAEPVETPERERDEQAELQRIEAGGIPTAAEQRLSQLRHSKGSFTSDLSVSGFALCHKLGLKPLSQVMGSSIYQVGYQGLNWQARMLGGNVLTELNVLSEAWNEVRRRALGRLELEARHAGADAVVGVELRTAYHDWAEGALEYVVLGTAVQRAGAQPRASSPEGKQPVLTELSVGDYAKLVNAGVEPLGIVAWTSVFFVANSGEMEMMGGLGGRMMFTENQELTAYTQGLYTAREQTMERLGYQAQQHGASGIVGVRIGHTIRRQELGSSATTGSRGGLMVTFDAVGTAVRDTATASVRPPQTNLDLSN